MREERREEGIDGGRDTCIEKLQTEKLGRRERERVGGRGVGGIVSV